MKGVIVASCRNPGIGLGNRITILCSAYASASVSGRRCVLYWPTGRGCRAKWDDLFKPLENVEIVDREPLRAVRHSVPSYVPSKINRMLAASGMKHFTEEYWDAWRECARSIRLIDDLALPETPEPFTAVSIRANWGPRSPRPMWEKHLALPKDSFICTDSPDAYQKAVIACEGGWSLSQPQSSSDMGSRGVEGMQAAARDMMMLTRASCILTIGERSTFRNLAHLGYQVPVFKFYRSRNP